MAKRKPDSCFLACSYARTGQGHCPDEFTGTWPPVVAFLLESPGKWEVFGHYEGYGRPLWGKAGRWWEKDCVEKFGYTRSQCLISNTLRCRPPGNHYPTGKKRMEAELACRQYDTLLKKYAPTVVGLTYHPEYTFKVPQVRKVIQAASELAFTLAEANERPLVIMGAKGLEARGLEWLNSEGFRGMKKWQRHWWRTKDDSS